jgi:DNA repair photolyase
MHPSHKGRGTSENPANRFELLHLERSDAATADDPAPTTELYRDRSRGILAENDSPDLGFRYSLNPYRGCEHGCVYCYARPSHEYLGFSAGLDFETRIMVKENAPELLRARFQSPRWRPSLVALSGNTDCYQPCERELRITRRCLEVFRDFLNPVGIITKSALICRDIDLLRPLAEVGAAQIHISITSLDPELARTMEPRASAPHRRLEAVRELSAAGIAVGVMTSPMIPGLNDHEIPRLLEAAAEAGASSASWTLLRLAPPLDRLFEGWLRQHYPDRLQRVMNRIRQCRGGETNDSRFGRRMRGDGSYAGHIAALFRAAARKYGLDEPLAPATCEAFRRPPKPGDQLGLFG